MADAIIGDILAGVLDACTRIIVASAKSLRYIFSKSYRVETNAHYAQFNPAFKWWHLLSGTLALLASVGLVAALALIIISYEQTPRTPLTEHQKIMDGAENGIIKAIGNHGSNSQ
jgi:hypothetical protein